MEKEKAASVRVRLFPGTRVRAPSLDDREEFLPHITTHYASPHKRIATHAGACECV